MAAKTFELLPCPFCGVEPEVPYKIRPSGRPRYSIDCRQFCVSMVRDKKSDVINDWNTRATKAAEEKQSEYEIAERVFLDFLNDRLVTTIDFQVWLKQRLDAAKDQEWIICPKCKGTGLPNLLNENGCTLCKSRGKIDSSRVINETNLTNMPAAKENCSNCNNGRFLQHGESCPMCHRQYGDINASKSEGIAQIANPKLHIICGACGCNKMFSFEINDRGACNKNGKEYPAVFITCGNCAFVVGLDEVIAERGKE